MDYNYLDSMTEDIKEYIRNTYTTEEIKENIEDRDTWYQNLNDDLWIEDSVTGNASGSYKFNTYMAEGYIAHNLDILSDALQEFGCEVNVLEKGAEWCDVTIRCYLLSQAIDLVLDEIEGENI